MITNNTNSAYQKRGKTTHQSTITNASHCLAIQHSIVQATNDNYGGCSPFIERKIDTYSYECAVGYCYWRKYVFFSRERMIYNHIWRLRWCWSNIRMKKERPCCLAYTSLRKERGMSGRGRERRSERDYLVKSTAYIDPLGFQLSVEVSRRYTRTFVRMMDFCRGKPSVNKDTENKFMKRGLV